MSKWTEYTQKEALKDNDELMILDTDGKANKRALMNKVWDWIVDKMANAVVSKLTTTDKTVLGAINELNSKANRIDSNMIYYSDSDVAKLGGLDNCVKDALLKKFIPLDGIFFKQFVCNKRYLMIGYRYLNGDYGCIILYDYDNATIRYNIVKGVTKRS